MVLKVLVFLRAIVGHLDLLINDLLFAAVAVNLTAVYLASLLQFDGGLFIALVLRIMEDMDVAFLYFGGFFEDVGVGLHLLIKLLLAVVGLIDDFLLGWHLSRLILRVWLVVHVLDVFLFTLFSRLIRLIVMLIVSVLILMVLLPRHLILLIVLIRLLHVRVSLVKFAYKIVGCALLIGALFVVLLDIVIRGFDLDKLLWEHSRLGDLHALFGHIFQNLDDRHRQYVHSFVHRHS